MSTTTTTSTTESFTKTETLRRLRMTVAECRKRSGLPSNSRIEVGIRTIPVAYDDLPTRDLVFFPGDDLAYHVDLADAASEPVVMVHGAVVHVYLSRPIGRGEFELDNTCTVWLGTPEADPVVLHVPGDGPGHYATSAEFWGRMGFVEA